MAEKQWNTVQMGAIEPHQRLQKLIADSQRVSIDPTMPINRYYRSGNQIVETADRSLREGNFEKAFTFYLRFVTIFVELILDHPGYKSVLPGDKQQTKDKIKKILPRAEEIRKKLLAKYTTEYEIYLKQIKLQAERDEQDRKQASTSNPVEPATVSPAAPAAPTPSAPSQVSLISDEDAKLMDKVMYPSDFLSDRNHASGLPGTGLLLPGADKRFDRSLKPQPVPPMVPAMTGFRSIVVPTNTMMKFLEQAAQNTTANLETCAILAGSLAQAKFTITHVIFPKQCGTADSCNTMNEEEIAVVQDRHNLITLGWIHTHPSQTAFLSSVDLHTHCSYQLMLEEAIAIVCSPKYQETGFFNLTPFGMDSISQCRQTGFHPHSSGQPLFSEAQHIVLSDAVAVKVIDLR
ncbi:STAM-binding protein [Anopheles ziemanni]|uniref:STAM-binding protein n=1 Tax=Anopheles coustani TaxID=139045 RepID=UPI00265B6556|nr:STAM-binding protein [Anopheles coustani]XP_058175897.1 STAM-binding protein [Anopheles ziemanni]